MRKSLLLILLLSFKLCATEMDVTSTAVLVPSQEKATTAVIHRAWVNLLSKYTGLSTYEIESANILEGIDLSSQIVRSYYKRVPVDSSNQPFWYHINTDADFLQQFVISRNLPIWPPKREPVYLWLVEEVDGEVQFASPQAEVMYWLKNWFEIKGVPLVFMNPLEAVDLSFNPEAVKNLSYEPVEYMTNLQPTANVLMLTIKQQENSFSYRLGLARENRPLAIRHKQFVNVTDGVMDVADFAQSQMADSFKLVASDFSDHTIAVVVNNLTSYDAVAQLFSYFDAHFLIEQTSLVRATNSRLEFRLSIKVKPDAFLRSVEGNRLIEYQPLGSANQYVFSFMQ
ncbi:DUF2066 domain-containing protein [Marinicella sp. W31]|uniref:DUF2066 domain-containing protein n=1 Tax=Marinicella sp. W31 TaxID=3023713 RepID=UPI00375735CD